MEASACLLTGLVDTSVTVLRTSVAHYVNRVHDTSIYLLALFLNADIHVHKKIPKISNRCGWPDYDLLRRVAFNLERFN